MKIHSDIIPAAEKGKYIFVLYLDKQLTGDVNQDCRYCACPLELLQDTNFDPDKLIDLISPMLYEMFVSAYGISLEKAHQKPMTNIKDTNFDPNCLNGVKGFALK